MYIWLQEQVDDAGPLMDRDSPPDSTPATAIWHTANHFECDPPSNPRMYQVCNDEDNGIIALHPSSIWKTMMIQVDTGMMSLNPIRLGHNATLIGGVVQDSAQLWYV